MPPRSASVIALVPPAGDTLLTRAFTGDRHSKAGLAQPLVVSLDSGAHKVLFEPLELLWLVWDLILNVISPLQLSCWGFSFALGCGYLFFGGIHHSPVDGCSVVSCNFGVLTGEDECTPFYSVILWILCI